jgi:AmmeMemoRadiSam system protein B
MIGTLEIRPPAVAGSFYPAGATQLAGLVGQMLGEVRAERRVALGVMVPHAGLAYSGACAAQVLARLALPGCIIILAPNHSGLGDGQHAGLWGAGAFETPLGRVPIAQPLAARLASVSDLVAEDREAHRPEHAIEVELPFLQVLDPGISIVPLVLPWDDWPRSRQLAQDLAAVIRGWPERVLLLASSDLTHYESAESAARKDAAALARVERLDGEGLLDTCRVQRISMCGRAPAAVVLEAARLLGATTGRVVDYRHSGLVSGDCRRVVGYGGVILE